MRANKRAAGPFGTVERALMTPSSWLAFPGQVWVPLTGWPFDVQMRASFRCPMPLRMG